jgi:hypothetical protein
MDSFGVIGTTPGLTTGIKAGRGARTERGNGAAMRYSAGRLLVSCPGDYRVSIVSMATGRTLARMRGHGDAAFALDPKHAGSGLYYAIVRTADGLDSRPFVFSKL